MTAIIAEMRPCFNVDLQEPDIRDTGNIIPCCEQRIALHLVEPWGSISRSAARAPAWTCRLAQLSVHPCRGPACVCWRCHA